MGVVLKNARVYVNGAFRRVDVRVDGCRVSHVSPSVEPVADDEAFDFNNRIILPGLIDVHVHLRQPGYSYKEDIASGTRAAARGGYTAVCAMPNLDPVPDCTGGLGAQLEAINKGACIDVYQYGTITAGRAGRELSDMEALSPYVAGFSDDGSGVQSDEIMLQAMQRAKALQKIIAAHCEDDTLLSGGYIHDGEYARAHGHRGISSESEYRQLERDLALVEKSGCAYHVCHVSTRQSVELIRRAKRRGLDVTCETAPHYLVLDDTCLKEDGSFKMNPPLRSPEDRRALVEGIIDGTVDMIATDHAPHSAEEKSRGLEGSLMGVVGLETAFPVLYTSLVKTGIITLERLVGLMHDAPSKRFNIGSQLEPGSLADLSVWRLDEEYEICPRDFLSKGKSTPFAGMRVFGKCEITMSKGGTVWKETLTEK